MIDNLILLENCADRHGLLKEVMRKLDLVCNRSTVDLNLHKVGLLLAETGLADLGVSENTDDGAVLADALEFTRD